MNTKPENPGYPVPTPVLPMWEKATNTPPTEAEAGGLMVLTQGSDGVTGLRSLKWAIVNYCAKWMPIGPLASLPTREEPDAFEAAWNGPLAEAGMIVSKDEARRVWDAALASVAGREGA